MIELAITNLKEKIKQECLQLCGMTQTKTRTNAIDNLLDLEMRLECLLVSIQNKNDAYSIQLLEQIQNSVALVPHNKTKIAKKNTEALKQEIDQCMSLVKQFYNTVTV
jgi:hypothetical protein